LAVREADVQHAAVNLLSYRGIGQHQIRAPIARLDAEVLNNESGDRHDSQQLERNSTGLETSN
jgi:hypothetical protein